MGSAEVGLTPFSLPFLSAGSAGHPGSAAGSSSAFFLKCLPGAMSLQAGGKSPEFRHTHAECCVLCQVPMLTGEMQGRISSPPFWQGGAICYYKLSHAKRGKLLQTKLAHKQSAEALKNTYVQTLKYVSF